MSELPAPGTVISWLDEQAPELDRLGKDLEQAHLDVGEAEVDWERYRDVELVLLTESYEQRRRDGESVRLPGEDVRLALIRRKPEGFDKWAALRRAELKVKGLEGRIRRLENAVGARQSTLKGIMEESRLPPVDPNTGEIIGRRR